MTHEEIERLKSYALPSQTGLGSDRKTCGRVIKSVLEVLQFPELRFERQAMPDSYAWSPENRGYSFEHDCLAFRIQLFNNLRRSGWQIKHDVNGSLIVR